MSKNEQIANCIVNIDGKVLTSPELLSRFGEVKIFRVEISNTRTSGKEDLFYLNYSSKSGVVLHKGDFINVKGDIRTVNDKTGKYIIDSYIYSDCIEILSEEPESYTNNVEIENAFLEEFVDFRKAYNDPTKDVSNYKISLYRGHNRISYFRVTSWCNDAITIANIKDSVEYFTLKGRLEGFTSKTSGKYILSIITYSLAC